MEPSETRSKLEERIISLKDRILKREAAVFSFFLVLAFIFWFLNGLSKEMNGRIEYPVRYINFPESRALVNELPDHLDLNVTGPGYSIVQTKMGGRREHLTIDLDEASIRVIEDRERLRFYILSFSLREELSTQIRSEFEISSISPDTIYFELDRIRRKVVPVIPDVKVITQRQYFVHGAITTDPDSVEVSGPRSIVDTVNAIYTRPFTFEQLKEDGYKTLGLKTIPKVGFSERRVDVNVPVAQYTEAVRSLPITLLNIPDSARVRLFPDEVSVTCIVALSDYNSFIDAPIEAVVDLKSLDIRTTTRLQVNIRNIPSFVSQLRLNPQSVEYMIEKR